jgi:single-strand DNA-binding protein
MQIITIAGNITKDAVLRRTQKGEPVLGFSVAVNGIGQDAPSTFFDCTMWGKRGETLESMIKKGGKVTVSGTFGTREHDGKTYLTVRANDVTLQGAKAEASSRSSYDEPEQRDSRVMANALDDDIPFAPEWR